MTDFEMPGILNRRDALLELKANEYTNKAIKAITERPPSPPPYIPKRIRSVPLSFTDSLIPLKLYLIWF